MTKDLELYLFVVWNSALYKFDEIYADLGSSFTIVKVIDINWDKDNFSRNLARFYGEKLPSLSRKEMECGIGPFKAIIIADKTPNFETRKTSRGYEVVNSKVFDFKSKFRKITGGGHKIHATNDFSESVRDIYLLTHEPYDLSLTSRTSDSKSVSNLIGSIQWSSFQELFSFMNQTLDYVVLRNFDLIEDGHFDPNHEDIDLLVRDKKQAEYLLNATKVHSWWFRVHYRVNVANRSVRFDIRYVGDGYYDKRWQERILATRKKFKGYYIPSEDNYIFSLLYHALIHKRQMSLEYFEKLRSYGDTLNSMMDRLKSFMLENGYDFTEPKDFSVYFNTEFLTAKPSFWRSIYEFLRYLNKITKKFYSFFLDYMKNKVREARS